MTNPGDDWNGAGEDLPCQHFVIKGPEVLYRAATSLVPAGKTRWSVRTYVADALLQAGQPDAALAFYEAAAKEAEASEHWTDVGVICQNWGNALNNVGQLDAAKATYLRSAEAKEKAGSPRVNVLGAELEAFRIDVKQDARSPPESGSGAADRVFGRHKHPYNIARTTSHARL